jgi:transcription elongation factor Elf1
MGPAARGDTAMSLTVVTCSSCGHSAAPRVPYAKLAGKTLKCTQCGTRQRLHLSQIIDGIQAEDAARVATPDLVMEVLNGMRGPRLM